MSLLLDALKKSGSSTPPGDKTGKFNSPGLTELTLEELPAKPASTEGSPAVTAPPAAAATDRSQSQNLFAAKKVQAMPTSRFKLGIIPTALITGLVLGTAGAIYVWYEMQPKSPQYLATAPRPAPMPSPRTTPAPVTITQESISAPASQLRTERQESKVIKPAPSPAMAHSKPARKTENQQQASNLQIQQQTEGDGLYAMLTAAYEAYQSGDLVTAEQGYRRALQRDNKNRDALLGMAAVAQTQGRDSIATQYYKQALILDPRDPVALANLSLLSSGDVTEKESRLKSSIAQSPQSAALYFALGNLYRDQSRWGDAQQAYFNAFKLEPVNATYSFNLATSLDHLGQGRIAAQYYQQAIQLDNRHTAGFDHAQTQLRINRLLGNQNER